MNKIVPIVLLIALVLGVIFIYPTLSVKASLYQERFNLFDIDGVVYAYSVNHPTPTIIVGVDDLSISDQIPKRINGYPVIVEINNYGFMLSQDDLPGLMGKFRPVISGIGIEIVDLPGAWSDICTLGAVVNDATTGEQLLLTASHCVTADQRYDYIYATTENIGNPVFQPTDTGTVQANLIGNVSKIATPFDTYVYPETYIDVAAIEMVDGINGTTETFLGPHISGFGGMEDIIEGNTVWKIGRTTGYSEGTIFTEDFYHEVEFNGTTILHHMFMVCDPMGGEIFDLGDSGAALISEDFKLLGILTMGVAGTQECMMSPLPWEIQDSLNLNIETTGSYFPNNIIIMIIVAIILIAIFIIKVVRF